VPAAPAAPAYQLVPIQGYAQPTPSVAANPNETFETDAKRRMDELKQEARELERSGRKENHRALQTTGYIVMGAGFGSALFGIFPLLLDGLFGGLDHSSDSESEEIDRPRPGLVVFGAGSVVGLAGLAILATTWHNTNRHELSQIERERGQLQRALKLRERERRQREREERRGYGVVPSFSSRALGLRLVVDL
jgi:hypothetical protein